MSVEAVKLFGVRHHGPGSARSLSHALEVYDPEAVLIEGPPDANELLPLASREDLEPPVALLVYSQDSPRQAVLYPFARFSPEWMAIRFALGRGRAVRFIDLPHWHRLADTVEATDDAEASQDIARSDPLKPIAGAAGYSDAERWWDHLVEFRAGNDLEVFSALHEMMSAVRESLPLPELLSERRREAYMRKCIRAAKAEGFARIAVVCGAYHTPALATMPSVRQDDELLRGLPKIKTSAAWVPWSYERLSFASGYGAGIESPSWYELLWDKRESLGAEWLTRAARLLRDEDVPASSAHVIEACRLADALAALRERPVPGLAEYNDSAVAVLGAGNAVNLKLIQRRWHFDARLGKVPEDFPAAPLQRDLTSLQKRLRLPPKAEERTLDLDLRESNDRERSYLLRRLRILGIEWGKPARHASGGKGTFHEIWQILWQPDFAVALIEASRYGHTVMQAAVAALAEKSAQTERLAELVQLLDDALFADLAQAIEPLVAAIERRAAEAADVLQLLDAIPPLVNVHRYGNVRETDVGMVAHILTTLVPRAFIGLPPAAANIDNDAARELMKRVGAADQALRALGNAEYLEAWRDTLLRVGGSAAKVTPFASGQKAPQATFCNGRSAATHSLLAGYAHRILYDAKAIDFDELATAVSIALSIGNAPESGATWIEGLLAGGGTLLIHDDRLRNVLDGWLRTVSEEHFIQVLPLLRRTFAQFAPAERRVLGERLRSRDSSAATATAAPPQDFDETAARAVLPLLTLIWNEGGEP
jgi:Family of unknown function (DUF5682)